MSTLAAGLALVALSVLAVGMFSRGHAKRDQRREQLLAESWAIYRASRAIHDQTAAALRALLDEARRSKPRPKG